MYGVHLFFVAEKNPKKNPKKNLASSFPQKKFAQPEKKIFFQIVYVCSQ